MNNESENMIRVLRAQIADLNRIIADLKAENARLSDQANSHESNPAKNGAAKLYIARLVGATEPPPRLGYNLKHSWSSRTFQVKFSGVQIGKRWKWTGVLEADGTARYDRLILVGETDAAAASGYREKMPPYVLFDVPASDVVRLANSTMAITSGVNPFTAKTTEAELLYHKYQVTSVELRERYGRSTLL